MASVRYVTPVAPAAATGQVAGVYAQLNREFGCHAPALTALSPVPDLLAATWSMLRESLLVGHASRTSRELVAVGVSLANRCPFCVDAHAVLLRATGASRLAETVAAGGVPADPENAALLGWAKQPRSAPPFDRELTPEYAGTALAFHFLNRVVSALLTEQFLPGRLQKRPVVRALAGRAFAKLVRRPLRSGESLPLLGNAPVVPPVWAGDTPVGTAYATLVAAAGRGRFQLSHEAEAVLRDTVNDWDGGHPPLDGGWLAAPLASLPEPDRPAARLALLAALAPYRITDGDVAEWRTTGGSDADLVRLVGFAAITAVTRVEGWLSSPRPLTV